MSNFLDEQDYEVKIGHLTPKKIGGGSYGNIYMSSKNFAVKFQKRYVIYIYKRDIDTSVFEPY